MTGLVTTFFSSKQYGFITGDADGKSRFFHVSNFIGVPTIGARVSFVLAPPTKIGKEPQCVNVTPVTESGVDGGK
jgi:cold shock CspA family protein